MSLTHIGKFAKMVADHFNAIVNSNGPQGTFVVGLEPDSMWELYLAAFPEGTNPVYKKNTEHDCSTCRQFIRRVVR